MYHVDIVDPRCSNYMFRRRHPDICMVWWRNKPRRPRRRGQ